MPLPNYIAAAGQYHGRASSALSAAGDRTERATDLQRSVAIADYWTGLGTGMLYSRATFSRTSLARISEERSPKSLATTWREWGQVVLPCGKSLDHMQLS
jgi:hypothetical protein